MSSAQNLLFGKILADNCMKMKEIGPRGDRRSLEHPTRSANVKCRRLESQKDRCDRNPKFKLQVRQFKKIT